MNDEAFLKKFEASQFAPDEWHHREHIKAAYLYLRRYRFEVALERMRTSIKALNAHHKVPESRLRGYHETTTHAWLRLVHTMLCQYGPARNADTFYEKHPELSQRKALRLFYSPQRLMSDRAKAVFVKPDLAPLPKPKAKQKANGK